jgi:RNA polymerase sigma factor for flagellar operon FliA
MVRFLAQKIHRRLPQHIDIDDLYSAGLVGLMQASANFDSAKKIKFTSFASFRVRGAILDSLRILDWAPRELRQKGRAIQEAIRTLASRLGHTPAEDEVAAELKISLDAYQHQLGDLDGLEIGTLHREREDSSGDEEVVYCAGRPEDDPLFRCMQGEITTRLAAAIQDLPEQERQVTTLYYYEEMNMREIGLALDMNPIRALRIRNSAVLHLHAALSNPSPRHDKDPLPMRLKAVTGRDHACAPQLAA